MSTTDVKRAYVESPNWNDVFILEKFFGPIFFLSSQNSYKFSARARWKYILGSSSFIGSTLLLRKIPAVLFFFPYIVIVEHTIGYSNLTQFCGSVRPRKGRILETRTECYIHVWRSDKRIRPPSESHFRTISVTWNFWLPFFASLSLADVRKTLTN